MNLFSVPISSTSKSQALAEVSRWLRQWRILNTEYRIPNGKYRIPNTEYRMGNSVLFPKIITTPNPEMIVAAQTDPEFLKALQSADLAIPDGIGIVWALGLPSRLSGLDFMESLILQPQKVQPFMAKLKIMLLGGRPGAAEKAAAALRRNFKFQISNFKLLALSGPPDIDKATPTQLNNLINSINSYSPDLLFVAFGHGKQEKWLTKNRHRLNVGVAMGIGGALDQIADPSLRPPAYINSIGLGWLYRLFREPRRWRRQLALVKFVAMIANRMTAAKRISG